MGQWVGHLCDSCEANWSVVAGLIKLPKESLRPFLESIHCHHKQQEDEKPAAHPKKSKEDGKWTR